MNRIFPLTRFLVATLVMFFISCNKSPKISFENPLQVEFGDPYILKTSDGNYYMIGTGGEAT